MKNPGVEVEKQAGKGKADSATAGKIAAGSQNPSPLPKPKTPAIEVKKPDGKGKAHSATASELAANKHMPSLQPKSKTPASEVKKLNNKGKAETDNAREDGKAAARSGRQAAPTRKSYRGDRG